MKLKDIPVLLDLVRLPLPVVWSRVSKRMATPEADTSQPDLAGISFSGKGLTDQELLPPAGFDLNKWQVLMDHYLQDELNFLGCGWTSLRNEDAPGDGLYGKFPRQELGNMEPDWNRDHRTGFQFDTGGEAQAELQKAFATEAVDVKWSWEFARMQHLPQLALGSFVYPKMKAQIHEKIQHHLASFDEQNPYGRGIHWSSPMEVSIRLVNTLVAYELVRHDAPQLTQQVLKFAAEHWNFVKNNLEDKDGFGTNHYLSNLMALIVTGHYLEGEEVRQMQSWAVGEFEFELTKQFHNDGFNFEYSTYYHRLSTEITMISLLAAQRSGFRLQKESLETLAKALNALELIQKPDGHLPQFGDNDSGRILDLDPAGIFKGEFEPEPENCSFCTSALHEKGLYHWFYEDLLRKLPEIKDEEEQEDMTLKYREPAYREEWRVDFAKVGTNAIQRADFPEAGLYVFRSDEFYLAINLMANHNGHRYRGHMHNDKSGFELNVKAEDLVRDPGIFSYTASVEERNRYRSTAAHPVPFAGIEQNRFLEQPLGLFHMTLDVKCELLEISRLSLTARISYRGVKHIRRFQIFEDHLLVTDFCNKAFTVNKKPVVPPASGYGKKL